MGILQAAENVAAAWQGLASQADAAAAASRPDGADNLAALQYRVDRWAIHAAALGQGYSQQRASSSETFTLAQNMRQRAQQAAQEAANLAAELQAQGDTAGAARALDLADQALAAEAEAFEAMQKILAAEVLANSAAENFVAVGRELATALAGAKAAATTYAEREQAGAIGDFLAREFSKFAAQILGAAAGPIAAAVGIATWAAVAVAAVWIAPKLWRAARRK